jgi:hypothetical protein
MKRAVPTLRFSIRKPRFPQAGLSPFLRAGYRLSRLACPAIGASESSASRARDLHHVPNEPRGVLLRH